MAHIKNRVNKISVIKINGTEPLNYLILLGLTLGPIWFGYFFEDVRIFISLFFSIIALLFYFNKIRTKEEIPLDIFSLTIFTFTMINLGSLFFAIDKRGALLDSILIIVCIFLFNFFKERSFQRNTMLVNGIFLSALGVAFLGLLEFCGMINLTGFRFGLRVQSTLQYANTTALFLFLATIWGIWRNTFFATTKEKSYLITLACSIMLFSFFLTFSRGIYVIALPLGILHLILLGKDKLEVLLAEGFIIFFPTLILVSPFIHLIRNQQIIEGWLVVLLNLMIVTTGKFIINKYLLDIPKLKINRFKSLVITVFLILAALILLAIDNPIINRLQTINITNASMHERFAMYNDAFKIITDHPLLGVGEGGWKALYQSYQTQVYTANEVHNNLLRIGVNHGIPGLLVYSLFWILALVYIWLALKENKKNSKADYYLLTYLFIANVGIFLHSLIDFDLSLPAIALISWSLLGYTLNLAREIKGTTNNISINQKKFNLSWKAFSYIMLILFLINIIISSVLLLGYYQGERGLKAINSNELAKGVHYLKQAVKYEPLAPQYQLALARTIAVSNPKNQKEVKAYYEAALALDPYGWDTNKFYGLYLIEQSHLAKGVHYLDKAFQYHPLKFKAYHELAGGYFQAADKALQDSNYEETALYFNKILNLYSTKGLPEVYQTPESYLVLGQIKFYQGHYSEALKDIGKAEANPSLVSKAKLWRALCLDKLNRLREKDATLTWLAQTAPDLMDRFYLIKRKNIPQLK